MRRLDDTAGGAETRELRKGGGGAIGDAVAVTWSKDAVAGSCVEAEAGVPGEKLEDVKVVNTSNVKAGISEVAVAGRG